MVKILITIKYKWTHLFLFKLNKASYRCSFCSVSCVSSGFEGCSWNVRNVFQTFFWSCHVFLGFICCKCVLWGSVYLQTRLFCSGSTSRFTSDQSKTRVSPQLWKCRPSAPGLWDLTRLSFLSTRVSKTAWARTQTRRHLNRFQETAEHCWKY